MLCTSYETMCPSCKHHFKVLRQDKVSAGHLEYTPNTFPVVFTCTQKVSVPVKRGTLMQAVYEQRERTVTRLRHTLSNYFHRSVNVYDHFDHGEFRYGDRTAVTYKILVDFPGVIAKPEGWATWISQFMGEIKFYELVVRSDGRRNAFPRAVVEPEKDQWEGCAPKDKRHLCWTRLAFFLERQGLVRSI